MEIYIQCDLNNVVLHVGTSPIGENPIEVEVDSWDVFYNPRIYRYANGTISIDNSLILNNVKEQKINELDRACSQAILANFTYQYSDGNTYSFSNDETAQGNFDKVLNAFDKNLATSISWTTYDSSNNIVRLTFDSTSFTDLYKAHLNHIQSNISKFRDVLQPQVEACTTVEAVNAIVWS